LWLAGALTGSKGLVGAMAWPAVVLGILAAVYSGFLFGQAEARDFWQTPLLPIHLFVQAVSAGASMLLLVAALASPTLAHLLAAVLMGGLLIHALLVLAEIVMPHSNLMVAQTSRLITRGPYARRFWVAALGYGVLLPLVMLVAVSAVGPSAPLLALAGVLALAGLLFYEDIWVQAGQAVPLS
jgi:formate-dependent nitrite reductase membrane component NrfD